MSHGWHGFTQIKIEGRIGQIARINPAAKRRKDVAHGASRG
jgi:hypothetical protein